MKIACDNCGKEENIHNVVVSYYHDGGILNVVTICDNCVEGEELKISRYIESAKRYNAENKRCGISTRARSSNSIIFITPKMREFLEKFDPKVHDLWEILEQ